MKISAVQSSAAAKLSASPLLATFGEPFLFDLHADERVANEQLDARIVATGGALRVGAVTCPRAEETIGGVFTPLVAEFSVFFVEQIRGTHTPRGIVAVEEIVRALCADRLPGEDNGFTCAGYDSALTERGYILHLVAFTHPVFVS